VAARSKRGDRPTGTGRRTLRCAIYTRKSSDEGLDQSFNSLDAQREACASFIASQKHEGWTALPTLYDDGGFSGGSLNRPGLQRLLADAENGAIDVVVVYKVDRLTRSLSDFAQLTGLFDRNGVSFVSVTQQFNTSTSMGRLTLNVLLSFAQFERELAGERIRDKIALSKRRGMWVGGLPPLGYDGIDKQLVVNAAEAEAVRFIFRHYLEVGSIADLKRALDAAGIVSKRRSFSDGKIAGGIPLSRGAIYQILRNHLYRGEIAYRGEVHAGKHEPIVDEALWSAVQRRLADQSQRPRGSRNASSAESGMLTGLVFDGDGNRLTPTYASKRGRRYRYYVSAPLVRGGSIREGVRVPAADLEALVSSALVNGLRNPAWLAGLIERGHTPIRMAKAAKTAADLARRLLDGDAADAHWKEVRPMLDRIVVTGKQVKIILNRTALATMIGFEGNADAAAGALEITIEAHALRCGKQVRMVVGEVVTKARPVDQRLVGLISDAHRWFEELSAGKTTIAKIAARDRKQVSFVSRLIPLAFLAPDIVEMIVDGRQPMKLTAERLVNRRRPPPVGWAEQRKILTI
jgi:DNA invertase Pin-like site-specific DNA recombinase